MKTLVVLCLVLGLCNVSVARVTEIVYPSPESASDTRYGDVIMMLRTALEKTRKDYGAYRLRPSSARMNERRALTELKGDRLVNVAWSSTSIQKESELIPIRISLRKDLMAYRLLLLRDSAQEKLAATRTLTDLRKLLIGQGIDWGDVEVYRANRIPIVTAGYTSLFRMVGNGRFDVFPRGINEIFDEYATHSQEVPQLRIERHLALYYPWPYYFFVNRQHPALAARIDAGLRRMLRDGSFDAIFWRFHARSIRRAQLARRCVIRLHNPLLPNGSEEGVVSSSVIDRRHFGRNCRLR